MGRIGLSGFPSQVPAIPPSEDALIQIELPSTLYFLAGVKYSLNFSDIIRDLGENSEVDVSGVPLSESNADGNHWEYTPLTAGTFLLTLVVRDQSGNIVASETRPSVVVSRPSLSDVAHLSIGDSITRAGGYPAFAAECMLDGRTVGIRTYDNGLVNVEGRGGWTPDRYLTSIAQSEGGDSPFLFPANVDGGRYLGNASFWKDVTTADPGGYHYDGFQMIARGWALEEPYNFNSNGYPVDSRIGDVIVDPAYAAGGQWREFDGDGWEAMDPQPEAEFSFSQYIARFGAAFQHARPTSISIMLGTVEFLSSLSEEGWEDYKSNLDTMIASIRDWNQGIPIVLIGPPSGGPSRFWSDEKVSRTEFNFNMIELSRRIFAYYDLPEWRAENVYVISLLGVVSQSNMRDYVHPNMPEGHRQMAAWLAGILGYLESIGKI